MAERVRQYDGLIIDRLWDAVSLAMLRAGLEEKQVPETQCEWTEKNPLEFGEDA